jgi:hypothetical protein
MDKIAQQGAAFTQRDAAIHVDNHYAPNFTAGRFKAHEKTFPGIILVLKKQRKLCFAATILALVTFSHNDFRPTGCAGDNIHFIHECTHQQHTAPGVTQNIFIVAWVGHILQTETSTLVHHMNHQLLFMQLKRQVDFSFAAFLIAILKGVHNAFMHREANFVLIVIAKSRHSGDTNTHLFSESNALDQSLQNHFNPLRFRGHPAVGFRLGTCMGNIAQSIKSIQYMMLGEISGGAL